MNNKDSKYEYNFEEDLKNSQFILDKIRKSDSYAQNLYAVLCNNILQKNEVLPILADKTWSCSWRYAGGIIADIRQEGNYLDWYCSGSSTVDGYVPESYITDEIKSDIFDIGWIIKNDEKLFIY